MNTQDRIIRSLPEIWNELQVRFSSNAENRELLADLYSHISDLYRRLMKAYEEQKCAYEEQLKLHNELLKVKLELWEAKKSSDRERGFWHRILNR